MKRNIKLLISFAALVMVFLFTGNSCKEEEYSMGNLVAPTDIVINTKIVGQDADNPNGDGSGVVEISVTAKDGISYKIGYSLVENITQTPVFENMPGGMATKKFTTLGEHTYRITLIAYGKGGVSSVATKDILVKSVFNPNPEIVTFLTGNSEKTWKVDKDSPGHFGVGPWEGSSTPEWWSASPGEKETCCNCFYTARFTFSQINATSFSMSVASPDGAFTKTGSLTSLPGIPASGDEGCYSYSGGSSAFSFIQASSQLPADLPSTQTSIVLDGNATYIGYGALQKEYEILEITENYMYLRVQGTETGNAWYLKMIPAN